MSPALAELLAAGPALASDDWSLREPALQRNRHPAINELGPLPTPGATILLDDAERPGEAAAIELRAQMYGLVFEPDPGSGAAIAQWQVYVAATLAAHCRRNLDRLEVNRG